MKNIIFSIFIILTAYFSLNNKCLAGNANGNVVSYAIIENGVLYFTLSGTKSNSPSCNTVPGRFAIDINNNVGKSWYATILASWITGKSIAVEGTNSCTVAPDSESVYNIYN